MSLRSQAGGRVRKTWLCLVLSAPAAVAQPVILHGPLVDSITYSSARITWITDVSSTTVIHYGTTSAYGGTTTGAQGTLHSWYLSGLAPATTYHFKVCSGASGSERCSGNQTLTTATAPAAIPAPPEPPRRRVDTSMPAGEYGDPFLVEADCSNLPSILGTIATLEGDLNYEIRIPARTVCNGQFVFPARLQHQGWIVVKSTEEAQLPYDARVTEQSRPYLATVRTDALPATWLALANLPTSCAPGDLAWSIATPGLPLYVCQPQGNSGGSKAITNATWSGTDPVVLTVPGHGYKTGQVVRIRDTGLWADGGQWRIAVIDENTFALDGTRGGGGRTYSGAGTATRNDAWIQVPHTAGIELPPVCTPNEWFLKTNVAVQEQVAYWCTAPNQWTNVRAINTSSFQNYAAIQLAPGARRYRFVGLDVTHIPTPDPPPPGWEKPGYRLGFFGSLVVTLSSNDGIIFDRCDIHGWDYPARLRYGFYLDGSNVAVINSRIHRINYWTEQNDGINLESCAINIRYGPGPGKIENNLLEAIGITIFFPDDNAYAPPQADYQIRRNHFSHPDKYLYGSPLNISGKYYMNRHLLELKAGQRMLIEGNLFDSNWGDINNGAMIMLTPRSSITLPAKTITALENGLVTVASPADPFVPGLLVRITETGAANHDGLWEIEEVLNPTTFKLKNPPTGRGTAGRVAAASSNSHISDIDIRNNIFRQGPYLLAISGHHDSGGGTRNTKTTQRVRLLNNLVYGMDARAAAEGGRFSPLGPYRMGRSGVALYVMLGMEDLIVRHNTILDFRGQLPSFLAFDNTAQGAHAGLEVYGNIFTAQPAVVARIGGDNGAADSLNLQWTQHPQPSWTVGGNVFCCTWPSGKGALPLPGNNYVDSEQKIGLDANYRLSSTSPFKNASGPDPGVNIDELYAALPEWLQWEFPSYTPRRLARGTGQTPPRDSR